MRPRLPNKTKIILAFILVIIQIYLISQCSYCLTYYSQYNTGPGSHNNCGPASVKMIHDQSQYTINDIREMITPLYYGSWHTDNILSYFNQQNIDAEVLPFTNINLLRWQLFTGKDVILAVDAHYLYPSHNIPVGTGHFIVVDSIAFDQLYEYTIYCSSFGIQQISYDIIQRAVMSYYPYYILIDNR